MKKPSIPANESERLEALFKSSILDTPKEEFFDRLAGLAASICGTQYAAISFIDENRQWFKSKFGFEINETPREISFCGHTILQNELFEITDALQDLRFADNPLVTQDPKIRFYAGMPLLTADGHALGTICVFDKKVRTLETFQTKTLESLAKKVMDAVEEYSKNKK